MPSELHGPRLTLRPLSAADEALYCAIYTDATVMAEVGATLSESAARRAFAAALSANAGAHPLTAYWVVVERGLLSEIGLIGLIAESPGRTGRGAPSSTELVAAPVGAGSAREDFAQVAKSSRAEPVPTFARELPRPTGRTVVATTLGPPGEGAATEAEVGAIILPAWHSRGYAAEAIALLAEYAFALPSCTRLHTRHAATNAAAIGLMEKLGFALVATDAEPPLGFRWELQRANWKQPGRAVSVAP